MGPVQELGSYATIYSEVNTFMSGRTVFLTGGIDTFNKVLIEKLLRTCNVSKIYVLVKRKDDLLLASEMFKDPLFTSLMNINPLAKSYVTCIVGDINGPELMTSSANYQTLVSEVSIVFFTKADENLHPTVNNFNISVVKKEAQFGNNIVNLKSFVYIPLVYTNDFSTLQSHFSSNPNGEEDKNPFDSNTMSSSTLKAFKRTKVSEAYVENSEVLDNEERPTTFTISVLKSPLLGSTYQEPIQGWMDHIDPLALAILDNTGLPNAVEQDSININIIPVDILVNIAITLAWHTAVKKTSSVSFYSCLRESIVETSWGNFKRQTNSSRRSIDLPSSIKKAGNAYNTKLTRILVFFSYSQMSDRLVQTQKMLRQCYEYYLPIFFETSFKCGDDLRYVFKKMNEVDKIQFPTTFNKNNLQTYLQSYLRGVKYNVVERHSKNKQQLVLGVFLSCVKIKVFHLIMKYIGSNGTPVLHIAAFNFFMAFILYKYLGSVINKKKIMPF